LFDNTSDFLPKFLLGCIIFTVTAVFSIIILENTLITKEFYVCEIVPIDGKMVTTTTDRYGRVYYNISYKHNNTILTHKFSGYEISETPKIEVTNIINPIRAFGFRYDTGNIKVYLPEKF
jgi:hypothetical protein